MNRRAASVVVLVGLLVSSACSRDDDRKSVHDITLGPRTLPASGAGVRTELRDAEGYTMAQVFDAEARGASGPDDTPAQEAPTGAPQPAAVASAAGSAAGPKTNPDDAILERTRVACGGCFASLRAGAGLGPPTRSARVALTVIPTGTVSRAEATSDDTNDPAVLDCIQRTARAATFSDNNGGPLRTYTIDVRVSASTASGSR